MKKTRTSSYAKFILVSDLKFILVAIVLIFLLNFIFAFIYLKENFLYGVGIEQVKNAGKMVYFLNSIYFSIVTSSTLGFGDITPNTIGAKLLVCIHVFISIVLFAFLTSTFLKLSETLRKYKKINLAYQLNFSFIGSAVFGLSKIVDAIKIQDIQKLKNEISLTEDALDRIYVSLNRYNDTPLEFMESYTEFRDISYFISANENLGITQEEWKQLGIVADIAYQKMLLFNMKYFNR